MVRIESDWTHNQADLDDETQQRSDSTPPHLAWTSENLHVDVAWQLATQLRPHVGVGDLGLKLSVESTDPAAQENEMKKHVSVYD